MLNNPPTFTDPFGLDTVEVDVHNVKMAGVKTGEYHASIRITPNNQEKWKSDLRFSQRDAQGRVFVTLGAAIGGTGQLVSNQDRSTDVGSQDARAVVPTPGSEDAAIENLLAQDANYKDNLPYALFPVASSQAYNSNSYVAGMLQAAGLHQPAFALPMPGYHHPVPASAFGVP